MAFTFGVAVLAGLLAGLVPALHAYRQDLSAVLAGGARAGGRQRSRLRTGMLVVQTSLSVVLLVGAGLFVRSLSNVRAIDQGFEMEGTLMIDPELDPAVIPHEQVNDFMIRAMARLERLPLVEGATATVAVPFWSSYASRLDVPDVPEPPTFAAGGPYTNPVAPDYFRTMGIDLLSGREFGPADFAEGAAPVAIVDETFASAYWPGQEPLGKCLRVGQDEPPCSEVIGVVEDTARNSLLPDEVAQYYVPVPQQPQWRLGTIMLKVDPDRMTAATDAVFREIVAMEGVRFARAMPLRAAADPQARSWQLGASMFTLFGVLALVIASVGLYGVLAFDVAQRTHEIGVRAALGATAGRVMRLVVRNAMTVILASVVVGVLAARGAATWLENLLYGVGPGDPLTLTLVAAVLLVVAVLASAVPAWRASRVDPVVALRED
jgi:predicted permease